MKKVTWSILIGLFFCVLLVGCGKSYANNPRGISTVQAEKELNDGKDLEGKLVDITVDKIEPKSAFGYNIQTGKHLNFVSTENPKVKIGDKLIVNIKKVESVAGSFIITYDKQ